MEWIRFVELFLLANKKEIIRTHIHSMCFSPPNALWYDDNDTLRPLEIAAADIGLQMRYTIAIKSEACTEKTFDELDRHVYAMGCRNISACAGKGDLLHNIYFSSEWIY